MRYPKGTNVFQQDEEAHSFFILLHGHLRVFKLTPDGQQVVVRFVAPGEVFGVAMAIGRKTYPATATAVVDSIALVWPSAAWPRLVATHPGTCGQHPPDRRQPAPGRPHPRRRDVDRAGRAPHRPRPASARATGRPQGRGGCRDRLPDHPPGRRRDDRRHAAHREPRPERLGEPRAGRGRDGRGSSFASRTSCSCSPKARPARGSGTILGCWFWTGRWERPLAHVTPLRLLARSPMATAGLRNWQSGWPTGMLRRWLAGFRGEVCARAKRRLAS